MPRDLQKLETAGFAKVGEWPAAGEKLSFELNDDNAGNARNVLYAFVSQSEVLYVGKTKRMLRQRLNEYTVPIPTQPERTRSRCNREIKSLLKSKKRVLIYALIDRKPKRYGEFRLNLAAGLEDDVIDVIAPEWNRSGKKKRKQKDK